MRLYTREEPMNVRGPEAAIMEMKVNAVFMSGSRVNRIAYGATSEFLREAGPQPHLSSFSKF